MVEFAPFLMIVAIVAIVSFTRLQRARLDRQAAAPVVDGDAGRMRDELARLRDRVQVLERIVTDGDRNRGLALEHEIERLRDGRRDRTSDRTEA